MDSFGALKPCAFAIAALDLWQQGHQESGFTGAGVDANGFWTPVSLLGMGVCVLQQIRLLSSLKL